jgi:hypothetical protein
LEPVFGFFVILFSSELQDKMNAPHGQSKLPGEFQQASKKRQNWINLQL